MEITIHRGTHQIGGCVAEIKSGDTRILVDFGAELEDNPRPLHLAGATDGDSGYDAVFFTHYHGDHVGMLDSLNKDIPLYIGRLSKQIMQLLSERMGFQNVKSAGSFDKERIDSMATYVDGIPIKVGNITVTPFPVDHSALDAHMLLIEANGRRILHTGDFRTHGFRGNKVADTLRRIGKVDALVCEGTVLGREDHKNMSEEELSMKAAEILKENKYVFVLCASTNIDRIAAFCNAVPRGKYCLCDKFQSTLIDAVKEDPDFQEDAYRFPKKLIYSGKIEDRYKKRGFCMFVRANEHDRALIERYKELNPVLVYSMWEGYRERESMRKFLDGLDPIYLHTSGHADPVSIRMMIDMVDPEVVIPIHTEMPERLRDLCGNRRAMILEDGFPFDINKSPDDDWDMRVDKKIEREEASMGARGLEERKLPCSVNDIYKAAGSNEAKWFCIIEDNLEEIKAGPYKRSLREDFDAHAGMEAFDETAFEKAKQDKLNGSSFSTEKWICKKATGQEFPEIGKIVDWQVPLKHQKIKGEDSEEHKEYIAGLGEIDNLSVNIDGSCAYLLEFKKPDSTESPLRAIMEAYTYWRMVGGDDAQTFLDNSAAKGHGIKELKKAIVLFDSDDGSSTYKKLERKKERYKALLSELGVECFIATLKSGDEPRIEIDNVRPWA